MRIDTKSLSDGNPVAFDGDQMVEIVGTFKEATMETTVGGNAFIVGTIYDDRLRRFKDGFRIHTSILVKELEKDVFLTRSGHAYRVESWRYPPNPQGDPGDENDSTKAP